jgi:hypothetical protein
MSDDFVLRAEIKEACLALNRALARAHDADVEVRIIVNLVEMPAGGQPLVNVFAKVRRAQHVGADQSSGVDRFAGGSSPSERRPWDPCGRPREAS